MTGAAPAIGSSTPEATRFAWSATPKAEQDGHRVSSTEQMVEPIVTKAPSANGSSAEEILDDPQPGFFQTFRELVVEVLGYRELLYQMTLRDLRLRYKQAAMGFGWAIFMPVMIVGAGVLVKFAMSRMAGVPIRSENLAGMAAKSLPWAFFVGSVSFATVSLTTNMNLVTRIYFPREMFPLSAVITQLVDSLVGSSVLGILLFVVLRVGITGNTLWVVPLVVLLVVFTAGVCLFLSCSNLFFRDVKYLVQILLTFGIFFTPVFYDAENLGQRGAEWLMLLNPVAPILEGIRLSVVEHHNLLFPYVTASGLLVWQPWYLLYILVLSVTVFVCSAVMFHRLEFVYAEYI